MNMETAICGVLADFCLSPTKEKAITEAMKALNTSSLLSDEQQKKIAERLDKFHSDWDKIPEGEFEEIEEECDIVWSAVVDDILETIG